MNESRSRARSNSSSSAADGSPAAAMDGERRASMSSRSVAFPQTRSLGRLSPRDSSASKSGCFVVGRRMSGSLLSCVCADEWCVSVFYTDLACKGIAEPLVLTGRARIRARP